MFEIKETPKTPSSNENVWKIEIAMHQRRTYLGWGDSNPACR